MGISFGTAGTPATTTPAGKPTFSFAGFGALATPSASSAASPQPDAHGAEDEENEADGSEDGEDEEADEEWQGEDDDEFDDEYDDEGLSDVPEEEEDE